MVEISGTVGTAVHSRLTVAAVVHVVILRLCHSTLKRHWKALK